MFRTVDSQTSLVSGAPRAADPERLSAEETKSTLTAWCVFIVTAEPSKYILACLVGSPTFVTFTWT
jgi:hypothetical protein